MADVHAVSIAAVHAPAEEGAHDAWAQLQATAAHDAALACDGAESDYAEQGGLQQLPPAGDALDLWASACEALSSSVAAKDVQSEGRSGGSADAWRTADSQDLILHAPDGTASVSEARRAALSSGATAQGRRTAEAVSEAAELDHVPSLNVTPPPQEVHSGREGLFDGLSRPSASARSIDGDEQSTSAFSDAAERPDAAVVHLPTLPGEAASSSDGLSQGSSADASEGGGIGAFSPGRTCRQAFRCSQQCNREAFLRVSGLRDENLIYDESTNAAGQSAPYYVAVDPEQGSIVIAIRGSLRCASLSHCCDCFTCCCALSTNCSLVQLARELRAGMREQGSTVVEAWCTEM